MCVFCLQLASIFYFFLIFFYFSFLSILFFVLSFFLTLWFFNLSLLLSHFPLTSSLFCTFSVFVLRHLLLFYQTSFQKQQHRISRRGLFPFFQPLRTKIPFQMRHIRPYSPMDITKQEKIRKNVEMPNLSITKQKCGNACGKCELAFVKILRKN